MMLRSFPSVLWALYAVLQVGAVDEDDDVQSLVEMIARNLQVNNTNATQPPPQSTPGATQAPKGTSPPATHAHTHPVTESGNNTVVTTPAATAVIFSVETSIQFSLEVPASSTAAEFATAVVAAADADYTTIKNALINGFLDSFNAAAQAGGQPQCLANDGCVVTVSIAAARRSLKGVSRSLAAADFVVSYTLTFTEASVATAQAAATNAATVINTSGAALSTAVASGTGTAISSASYTDSELTAIKDAFVLSSEAPTTATVDDNGNLSPAAEDGDDSSTVQMGLSLVAAAALML